MIDVKKELSENIDDSISDYYSDTYLKTWEFVIGLKAIYQKLDKRLQEIESSLKKLQSKNLDYS